MNSNEYYKDQDATISALFEISNLINCIDDLDNLYKSIHISLNKVLNLENFAVAIYHKERDSMTFPYFVDEMDNDFEEIFDVSKKQSLSARVINAGKQLIFYREDIIKILNMTGGIGNYDAIKVWAGVPIKIKGRVFGALLVRCYRLKDAIEKSDLYLLNSVAELIAISIEQKQMQIAREETEKINHALRTITNAVHTTENLSQLYKYIRHSLSRLMDTSNFFIALYYSTNNTIKFEYFVDQFDKSIPRIENLTKINSLTGEVIIEKKPLLLNENMLLDRAKKKKIVGTVPKIWLGVPLNIRGEVIGVVAVQSYFDANLYNEKDLQVLVTISDQIAIAIYRKQIQIAKKQSDEINLVLREITSAVHSSQNLSELFETIHNTLSRIMNVSNFFIAIVDMEEHSLYFPYYVDTVDDNFTPISNFDTQDSLTGLVITQRKPILLKAKDLKKLNAQNSVWGPVPLIWMGVPLIIKDDVIGVLAVQSYLDPNLYNKQDLQVLSAISDQMAIAIDRKRAEDALRESEARYRLLADSLSDVVWTRDMDQNLTYISPSVETQSGFSVEEKMVQPLNESMTSESMEKISQVLSKAISLEHQGTAAPKRSMVVEIESYRKDGTIYPMESVVSFMRDNAGKAVAIVGINRDITERKKADEALRLTFETSPDIIVINRLEDGLFVEINQSFVNTTGYTREEVFGKTTLELNIWNDPRDLNRLIKELRRKRKVVNIEAKFRCKDGSLITGLMSASLIELNGQKHVINITRNIENIKKDQKEKAELQAHLNQAQKMEAIGTLAGGIAHDFNNILSGILGYSELIQEDLNDLSCNPITNKRMRRVIKASLRAKDLVTQILDFSRSTRKDPTPINVTLIVKEVLQLLRASLPSSIKIEQALDSNCFVMADPTGIHQILMNLCTNAKDAMNENGGILFLQLKEVILNTEDVSEYEGVSPGHFLLISVKDTGHGMKKEVLKKTLEPFYTTKPSGKGTGMGLSVVHGIVKSLDGFIKIFSTLGKGSTFDVFLPVHEKNLASNHIMLTEIENCEGTEKILVIDDEETLAEMIRDSLEHFGYKATFFSNIQKALEHFKENLEIYDLIISDITMPEMTGDILVEQIRLLHPSVPVILLTGFNELVNSKKAESMQINALLYKPVPAKEMLSTIRTVLDKVN